MGVPGDLGSMADIPPSFRRDEGQTDALLTQQLDSSSDGEGSTTKPGDPLHDESADDRDERWVRRNLMHGSRTATEANTSYRLTCPCCFTLLCLQCQPHEEYVGQFRAVFVQNCTVSRVHSLKVRTESGEHGAAAESFEKYKPVSCSICETEVAVLDDDEVYHFCNVLY